MGQTAESSFDPKEIRNCLDEIEGELFAAVDNDECQRFHKDTQLTATLLLLLRLSSLMRSLLLLNESADYDGFDAVLRAFEETWFLAHELRLTARHDKAMEWLAKKKDTWKAKVGILIEFAKGRGHSGPKMGADYNLLSELAHPTRTAAGNSVTLCGIRRGIDGAKAEVAQEENIANERIRYALYRLAWLILDQDAQFINIPADAKKMPLSEKFLDTYDHIEPET
jgi:hypothetical protein